MGCGKLEREKLGISDNFKEVGSRLHIYPITNAFEYASLPSSSLVRRGTAAVYITYNYYKKQPNYVQKAYTVYI